MRNFELIRCLVVIPTYNEVSTVPILIKSLLEATPDTNILIVDDGSPDGTGELCDEIANRDSRVQVLHRHEKQGLGAAYLAGLAQGVWQSTEDISKAWQLEKKFSPQAEPTGYQAWQTAIARSMHWAR